MAKHVRLLITVMRYPILLKRNAHGAVQDTGFIKEDAKNAKTTHTALTDEQNACLAPTIVCSLITQSRSV